MSELTGIDAKRRRLMQIGLAGSAAGAAALLSPFDVLGQSTETTPLKIGVIGSGHIGGTIGGLWVKAGHPVFFSSRHPEELKDMVAGLGKLAQAGAVADAITFGEVLFLAVPYGAMPEIGQDYGAAMKGKVVLDAGNAVTPRDGAIVDEVTREGIGVTSQKYLAGARLVRAFNTMNYQIFAREANRADPRLAIPIAGDDPDAVRITAALVHDAGFEAVVVGRLADARRFQRGEAGYGQNVSAAELRKILSLAP